jgi:hypothetical protein
MYLVVMKTGSWVKLRLHRYMKGSILHNHKPSSTSFGGRNAQDFKSEVTNEAGLPASLLPQRREVFGQSVRDKLHEGVCKENPYMKKPDILAEMLTQILSRTTSPPAKQSNSQILGPRPDLIWSRQPASRKVDGFSSISLLGASARH